jgi:hypothetical protein
MKDKILNNTIFLLSLLLTINSHFTFSQTTSRTIIRGTVTDSHTGDPIPWASVLLKGTSVGTTTDKDGKYTIETSVSASEISFSFIGYETETKTLKKGATQTINIRLKLSSITLDEVRIKPARMNYKNKGNPAVELIQNVIEHKKTNRKESFDFLQYRKYEKIQFALSDVGEGFRNSKLFEKYNFIFDNIDTTKRIGNNVLPVFIREEIAEHYYRKQPEANKDVVRAQKTINLDEYLDNKGVSANLNYLYQDVNIYDNQILFMTNKFLSPVAVTAPTFYRYYIQDTIQVKDIRCIKLFFEPRNPADFLFHGNLYITLDSTYAIRKIDLGINKKINIDWIKDISVTQDFEKFGNNLWLLSKEEISLDAGIMRNTLGLYGQRTIAYSDYRVNEPIDDSMFKGPVTVDKIDPASAIPGYWEINRQVPLSKNEKRIYSTIDSVRKVDAFRRQMNIVMLITTGFYNAGKVEFGPWGNFYSFNTVEGSRVRFGGRTTPAFSRKITFDAYGAYGFRDNTFKYNAGVTWSLTPRTIYQFPVKSLKLSYTKDTRIPGQELQFAQGDNLFLSFKRGVDDKLFLNNTVRFEFLNEFENHFSYLLGYRYTRQTTEGNLHFNYSDVITPSDDGRKITISEPYVNLRFAPNETFYQGKLYRDPFPNKYPVTMLNIAGGSKQFGSDFDYLRLQLNLSMRVYVSIIGYTDFSIEGGQIFGKVPYPLLFIHNANQTYSYQKNSYNLMNFLEFVSDKYVSLNIDHCFNGFFLNKVPLLKKLKLREIVTCKVLYGGLGRNNNPDYNSDLFKFPVDLSNVPLTYTLEKKPYIEASIGLSNIFRILRVDLIKRFSYLGHPNVSGLGFRVQFKLDI